MITYRATLDVPAGTVSLVSRWLVAHRRAHDSRPWQRAATPYVQAVMVLRWFKDVTDLRLLARDARVSVAPAYRYVHEGIDVIAARTRPARGPRPGFGRGVGLRVLGRHPDPVHPLVGAVGC